MDSGAVIVAAGSGTRLGHRLRKAMVPLGGVPLVLRAAEAFAAAKAIREIVLVIHEDDHRTLSTGELGERAARLGITAMVPGGARRQDSVAAGLRALSTEGVLVHDAARPFVRAELVDRLAARLDEVEAVVPVVAVTSTVKRVLAGRVVETVPRLDLRLAQTPQAARRELLLACLERADREGRDVTDDVQALEAAGIEVFVEPDSGWNFKITTPEDLRLAEVVFRERIWRSEP